MLGHTRIPLMRSVGAAVMRGGLPMHLRLQARGAVGIKIMEDKGKAQESLYWAQEDEKLLKKMLENNPDLNPEYQGISGILDGDHGAGTTDRIKLIFMKHG